MMEGSGSKSGSIHILTDPDPQHCFQGYIQCFVSASVSVQIRIPHVYFIADLASALGFDVTLELQFFIFYFFL
jgi:hypothetical protein